MRRYIKIYLITAAALSISGATAPTHPQMQFQFNQNGMPSTHIFTLIWAQPQGNLTSINVTNSLSQEVTQTITVPQDKIKLHYEDIFEPVNNTKDKIVDFIDYNFDRYADLRLLKQWPYKVGEKGYLVFLFNPENAQYTLNEGISALPAPTANPKTRHIETITLGSIWGGGEYEKNHYSIDATGHLQLEAKIIQKIFSKIQLMFIREVREKIDGSLQRVCKIEVPGEGKPRIMWGLKQSCEKYLTKD